MSESFTCPRCGRTSHNPNDVREGYCGNCHAWTRDGIGVPMTKTERPTLLSREEYERLIYLIDLLNDASVTQLDTDEQQEYLALLAKLND